MLPRFIVPHVDGPRSGRTSTVQSVRVCASRARKGAAVRWNGTGPLACYMRCKPCVRRGLTRSAVGESKESPTFFPLSLKLSRYS